MGQGYKLQSRRLAIQKWIAARMPSNVLNHFNEMIYEIIYIVLYIYIYIIIYYIYIYVYNYIFCVCVCVFSVLFMNCFINIYELITPREINITLRCT